MNAELVDKAERSLDQFTLHKDIIRYVRDYGHLNRGFFSRHNTGFSGDPKKLKDISIYPLNF